MKISVGDMLIAPRLGFEFGPEMIKAVEAALPGNILRKPIRFPTSSGDWWLGRVDVLRPYTDRMEILGVGSFNPNDDFGYKARIDVELHGLTREATIKFIA